jgi:hypothetical protein
MSLITIKTARTVTDHSDKTYAYSAEFSNGWRKIWIWDNQEQMNLEIADAKKQAQLYLDLLNEYSSAPKHLQKVSPKVLFRMIAAAEKIAAEDRNWQEIILSLSKDCGTAERLNIRLMWALGITVFIAAISTFIAIVKW